MVIVRKAKKVHLKWSLWCTGANSEPGPFGPGFCFIKIALTL